MKLSKHGHYKPEGSTILADAKGHSWWLQNRWCLLLGVTDPKGPSTYKYELEFSADELVALVETALTGASKHFEIQASLKKGIVKGILSLIRKILAKNNQDPKYRLSSPPSSTERPAASPR